MEKLALFKFSTEELRKINILLPKGYKFVPREDIVKKKINKIEKKKVNIPTLPQTYVPSINAPVMQQTQTQQPSRVTAQLLQLFQPEVQHVPKAKIQRVKDDEAEFKRKIVLPPPIFQPPIAATFNLQLDSPSGTSQKLLQRLKKNQSFDSLMRVSKVKESDISLKQIEGKVASAGQAYRISELENDLRNFCLMVYKTYQKTTPQYRQATQLQGCLNNLIKIQKNFELRRSEANLALTRNSSSASANSLRRRPQPIKGSVYQPFIETKNPTPSQKRLLGQMIKKLPSQSLQQVCYIVFQSTENKEYIFDLDTLHVKKFRELQQFVRKCMQKTGEWQQRNFEDEQFSNESDFVIDDDNE